MKLKKQLVKRNIAGDVILVPVGDSSLTLKGLMTLNETAEFIWDRLSEAAGAEELAAALCGEYEVDAVTARADVDEILAQLAELGIL